MAEVILENGKYRFYDDEETGGNLKCDRHGEPWREFIGDKAVYSLFLRCIELQQSEEEDLDLPPF